MPTVASGPISAHAAQVRHVERACFRIDRPKRKQEQGRSKQVEQHVLHTRPQALVAARMDHQAVRGDQQNLKEDKEVEQGHLSESAHDAHQLELEQRMEMPPALSQFDPIA